MNVAAGPRGPAQHDLSAAGRAEDEFFDGVFRRPPANPVAAASAENPPAAGPAQVAANDRDLIRHVVTTLRLFCREKPNTGIPAR